MSPRAALQMGWSAPTFFTIGGGSWGLQIGVEGIDLVMIIQSDRGMEHLLSSKFQIGGDASASSGAGWAARVRRYRLEAPTPRS